MNDDIPAKTSKFPVKRTILAVILIFIILFLIFWLFDTPPIENDYTIADLHSASPQYAASYDLLLSMGSNDPNVESALPIGLSAEDVNILGILTPCGSLSGCKKDANNIDMWQKISQNADKIDRLWQNSEKGRLIIKNLNNYAEIADLTEPNIMNFAQLAYLANLRKMVEIYKLYLILEFQRDNHKMTAENLCEIYSVITKLSLTARPIITKLICFAGINGCIETANLLANHPKCSAETLNTLSNIFSTLDPQVVSMRNCLISEYLSFKNEIHHNPAMVKVSKTPILKENSILRVSRNYIDEKITAFDSEDRDRRTEVNLPVWPKHLLFLSAPRITPDSNLPKIYFIYNPLGSLFISLLTPALEQVMHIKTKTQIYDDLLQIVFNLRLGKPYLLKASAYSDEYIIDLDKKIIFSPGQDGQPYTDDDIKLEINPEVLVLAK